MEKTQCWWWWWWWCWWWCRWMMVRMFVVMAMISEKLPCRGLFRGNYGKDKQLPPQMTSTSTTLPLTCWGMTSSQAPRCASWRAHKLLNKLTSSQAAFNPSPLISENYVAYFSIIHIFFPRKFVTKLQCIITKNFKNSSKFGARPLGLGYALRVFQCPICGTLIYVLNGDQIKLYPDISIIWYFLKL